MCEWECKECHDGFLECKVDYKDSERMKSKYSRYKRLAVF